MLLRNILKLLLIVAVIESTEKLEAAASAEPSQNTEQTFFAALNEGNAPYAAQILHTMSQYYSTERLAPLIRRFVQQLLRTPLSTDQKLAIAESIGTIYEFQDSPVLQWLRALSVELQDELRHDIERRYGLVASAAVEREPQPAAMPQESASQGLRELFIKAIENNNWPLASNYYVAIRKALTDQAKISNPEEIYQLNQKNLLYSSFLISNIVNSNLSKFDKNTLQNAFKNVFLLSPLKTWLENSVSSLSYEERKAILIQYYPGNSAFAESLAREPLQAENLPKITLPEITKATKPHSSSRQGVASLKELALNSLQADAPRPWQPTRRLTPSTDSSPIPSQASPRELAALASELLRSGSSEITKQRVVKMIDSLDVSNETKDLLFEPLAQELSKQYYLRELKKDHQYPPAYMPNFLREHFSGLSIQDYLNSNIQFVEWDPQTQSLSADLNKINNLNGLNNIPHVRDAHFINLQGNYLKKIPTGAITNLSKLESLSLAQNFIETIEGGAFKNLPNLAHLDLKKNNLFQLPIDFFTMLPNLKRIDLSFNQFNKEEKTRIIREAHRAYPYMEIIFEDAPQPLTDSTPPQSSVKSLKELAMNASQKKLLADVEENIANIIEQNIVTAFAQDPRMEKPLPIRTNANGRISPPPIANIIVHMNHAELKKYWQSTVVQKLVLKYLEEHNLQVYKPIYKLISLHVRGILGKRYHLYNSIYGPPYRRTPPEISVNFTKKYSIQDLLDVGLITSLIRQAKSENPNKKVLRLSFRIDSLKGLQNIPNIENLDELKIRPNFSEIPANSFVGLKNLTHLEIHSYSSNGIKIAKDAFNGLYSLGVLDLSNNGLTHFDFDILKPLRRLIVLELRGNDFSPEERARIRANINILWPNFDGLFLEP